MLPLAGAANARPNGTKRLARTSTQCLTACDSVSNGATFVRRTFESSHSIVVDARVGGRAGREPTPHHDDANESQRAAGRHGRCCVRCRYCARCDACASSRASGPAAAAPRRSAAWRLRDHVVRVARASLCEPTAAATATAAAAAATTTTTAALQASAWRCADGRRSRAATCAWPAVARRSAAGAGGPAVACCTAGSAGHGCARVGAASADGATEVHEQRRPRDVAASRRRCGACTERFADGQRPWRAAARNARGCDRQLDRQELRRAAAL